MGQADIMDWLGERRLAGDDRFFSREQIERAMLDKGLSVFRCRRQLNKLYVYHYLEIRLDGFFNRSYRLKRKYIKGRGA